MHVDVNEGADPAQAHRSAVLLFHCCEVSKVGPLDGFFGILGRLSDVEAIALGHGISCELQPLAHWLVRAARCVFVDSWLFKLSLSATLFDQLINAVQRYPAVVTDDPAAAVSIWQTSDNV